MLGAAVMSQALALDSAQVAHTPGECWWPQIELVLAAATDSAHPPGDFGAAVGFLEINTGIESGLELTFVGYALDRRRLRRSSARWIDWFAANYPYLYWDPERSVFRVDAQARDSRIPTRHQRGPQNGGCYPKPAACEDLFGADAPLCARLRTAAE